MRSRWATYVGALIAIAVSSLFILSPPESGADVHERSIVKLYSGGEVVGKWEAVGNGQMDGDTYVFPVEAGVQRLEVRISGAFSVESLP